MSYTPPLEAEETGFKTTTPVLAGLTFNSTGSWDGAVDGYTQVQTEIVADQDGTIAINFCADAGFTDVVRSLSIPYTAANGYQFFAAPAFGNFIEYKFTNTSITDQTNFYYTTKILTTAVAPQLLTTNAFIAPSMVTSLGRSITVGENPTGTIINEKVEGVSFVESTPLDVTGSFTTGILSAIGYQQVSTTLVSDQDGVATFEFLSGPAGPVVRTLNINYDSTTGFQLLSAPTFTDYVRYSYTNGAVAQTTFHYETKLLTGALSGQVLPLNAPVFGGMVANLGRNVSVGKDINGAYTNSPNGGVSNTNSTSTPLSGSEVYNGTFVNTDGYSSTSIFVKADEDSAASGLQIVHSSDGITDDRVISLTYITANNPQGVIYLIPASTKYFRLRYVNGVTPQTAFIATVKFETSPQMLPTLPVNIPISDNTLANTVKSVSVGQRPDMTYNNVPADGLGFSTFTPLTSGSTYSSGILDMSSYTQVQTDITSDGSGVIDIEFIRDAAGTDVVRNLSIPYVGGSGFKMFSAPAFTPYVRYNYTANTTGSADFYFDTKFTTKAISGQILGMTDFIASGMVANLGRNVLVGQEGTSGGFNNVSVVPTTNDTGTYYNLQVVSGARPSQIPGRVKVSEVVDTAVSVLQRTITAGKTYFITDILLTIDNTDASSTGRVNLRDGLTVAGVIVLPIQVQEAPQNESATQVVSHTFAEPIEFSTGLFIEEGVGINTVTGVIIGYEE